MRRAVKSVTDQPIPITTALNISALAREHGVSRKTITRRLAKGWRPGAHPVAPIPRTPSGNVPLSAHRSEPVSIQTPILRSVHTPPHHQRPPLGMVRTVLLLLGVAFYVFIALAAVHR